MSIRRLVVVAVLAAACGRTPVPELQTPVAPVAPVSPAGAVKTSAVTAAVKFTTNPDGFHPLSLNRAVRAETKAGEKAVVSLGVPASAQAAVVSVRAKGAAKVTSGGVSLAVSADGQSAVALLPLTEGKLELVTDADVELSVRASGWLDQSGAGLSVRAEPATEVQLAAGSTKLQLAPASASAPDDTWGRWLRIRAAAGANDARFELRSCGNEDALEVVNVPKGEARTTVLLAPRGEFCAYASEPLSLQVQVLARHRRFDASSTRAVEPVTVLDTAAGIAFSGAALAGQRLEVELSKLQGLSGATAAVLRVDGALAGPCDGEPAEGALVLHDLSKALCLESPAGGDVRATLLALALPSDPVPLSCPALPAEPQCAAADLLGRLNCIPGVRAVRGSQPETYVVDVTQPVDHARPDGETFEQRLLVTYAGAAAPVVLHTTGYTLFSYKSDLGRHLNATEVEVEHRFFGTSTPASRDFSKLDIVQSALDSHRIVELLKPVLKGKWLSTGHSKGGMTAVFHRRFFPCDTDGSVPYVTPISYSMADPRYGTFLQNVGGARYAACREVFRQIDRGIIANRAAFAPQLRGTYQKMGGAENALWEVTGMMSWGLFQYGELDDPDQGCPAYEAIAASPADMQQLVAYYAMAGEGYSDQSLSGHESDELFGYVYQTTNELGSQGASREHLVDLGPVPALPATSPLSLGSVKVPEYEARAMRDVQDWVARHGSKFLFIYGELDPWTGGQLEVGDARETMKVMAPGANHGARFDDLTPADRLAAEALIQRWVGANGPRLGLGRSPGRDWQPEFRDVMARFKL